MANRRISLYGDEEPLYNPELLKQLDFSKFSGVLNPPVSVMQPGDQLRVRPLCPADYDRGFLELLEQLTTVGNVSKEQFLKRFAAMKAAEGTYYVTVVEDSLRNRVVAAATLVVEQKFVHNAGVRGFLEDVVVNNTYRGKQLGKLIVATVGLLAEYLKCYKITLTCKDNLIPFYKSLGYVLEAGNGNYMQMRFEQKKAIDAKL
ncbi:probable glucosamine 6-phosphate N-acetyltransferase isoform X2 [Anabrus simplex]